MSTRDQSQLIKQLRRLGLRVEPTGGGHWKVYAPAGMVFLPATPSDHRGTRNNRSLLRRYGVNL